MFSSDSKLSSLKILFLIGVALVHLGLIAGKCYTTKPGITIHGSEYRKEYELQYNECGRACFTDISCMAFEWRKEDGECTFKTRSLNGTFVEKPGVFFGLCLDRADPENLRDFFYDHEFSGVEYASSPNLLRDECSEFCMANAKEGLNLPSLSYSWRPYDAKNADESEGKCTCTQFLHHVKLSFGSISGYLL